MSLTVQSLNPVRVEQPTELPILKKALSEATVQWIETIVKSRHEALDNYSRDHKFVQKNIWYAEDLLRACEAAKQPKMVIFIRNGMKQLIGYLPTKYFEKIPEPDSKLKFRTWHFLAKTDVLPSEALKAAVAGLSIIDCGMACQMARYGALLDILKEAKFNRLFGAKYGQVINIGLRIHDKLQPMRYFVDFSKAASAIDFGKFGHRPVEKGQVVGFEGVPSYQTKYPYGHFKAMSVICMDATQGEQTFLGFGTPLKGSNEKALCQSLLDHYTNGSKDPFYLAPDDESTEFAKIAWKHLSYKFSQPSEVGGYHPGTPEEFIPEVIKDLVEMPLEEISIDFVKKHPANINRFND